MSTRVEADDLLLELLQAFGLARAPRRTEVPWGAVLATMAAIEAGEEPADAPLPTQVSERTRKRAAGPLAAMTQDEHSALLHRELVEALPTLRDLVAEVRRLRSDPLPLPSDYAKRWRAIVDRWNAELERRRWQDLPPLCTTCGTPVFVRSGAQLEGGGVAPSIACSTTCQENRPRK